MKTTLRLVGGRLDGQTRECDPEILGLFHTQILMVSHPTTHAYKRVGDTLRYVGSFAEDSLDLNERKEFIQ